MSGIRTTLNPEIRDPNLQAIAGKIADLAVLGATKAFASLAAPGDYPLPRAANAFEGIFLRFAQSLPADTRKQAAASALAALRQARPGRLTPWLDAVARVNLHSSVPIQDQMAALVPDAFRPLAAADLKQIVAVQQPYEGPAGMIPHQSPSTLTIRMRHLICHEETGWTSAGSDHIYMGGSAVDAVGNVQTIPVVDLGGDWDSGDDGWFEIPLANTNMDLGRGWPRTFCTVVAISNKAEGGLWDLVNNLVQKLRDDIAAYCGAAAGAYIGLQIGGALGGAAGPIGAAVGAIVGAVVGWIVGEVWNAIKNWLQGHVFVPVTLQHTIWIYHDSYSGSLTSPLFSAWWQGAGGHYTAEFDLVLAWANISVPTVVSRRQDYLDLFRVGQDCQVRSAGWAGGPWGGWWNILDGQTTGDAPVLPLARGPDNLDVFMIGFDGRVWTAAWGAQTGHQWAGWWPILDGTFLRGSAVGGVVKRPDQLDIFATGLDGQVYSAAWAPDAAEWHGWWRILDPGTPAFPPGAPVSAVSCTQDEIDIYCVAADGRILSAAWGPWTNYEWRGWWHILDGCAAPGSLISAVTRGENLIDLFGVGTDGQIWTGAWDPQMSMDYRGWWLIPGLRVAQGTPITAVARAHDNLDVFCVAGDSQVWMSAWGPQTGYAWAAWQPVPGAVFTPGSPVAVTARNPEQLDIFVNGLDGNIWSCAWHNGWSGWFPVLP